MAINLSAMRSQLEPSIRMHMNKLWWDQFFRGLEGAADWQIMDWAVNCQWQDDPAKVWDEAVRRGLIKEE